MPEQEIDQLYGRVEAFKSLTSNTITDPRRLKEHLRKVRNEGVAYDFEENVVGVVCMGAAVRNFTGKTIAAMSISLPIQRLRGDNLITLKEHLLDAVGRLSAELGYNVREAATEAARESTAPAAAL